MGGETTGQFTFKSEQDGTVERELKRRLVHCLSAAGVVKAYLVRVSNVDGSEERVALCLDGGENCADSLVPRIGAAFQEMFADTESLDIVFLTASEKREIEVIARAFYGAS